LIDREAATAWGYDLPNHMISSGQRSATLLKQFQFAPAPSLRCWGRGRGFGPEMRFGVYSYFQRPTLKYRTGLYGAAICATVDKWGAYCPRSASLTDRLIFQVDITLGAPVKRNGLKSMSLDELWKLHEEIVAELTDKIANEKARLEERLRKIEAAGYVREQEHERRPYPKVLPKYQNPNDPAETWSGRGKQPRWLGAQLRAGKKLDDFRIDRSPKTKALTNLIARANG
jgi:DNA-binding protein H-NS